MEDAQAVEDDIIGRQQLNQCNYKKYCQKNPCRLNPDPCFKISWGSIQS